MTKEEQQKFFGISNDVVFKIVFCQQYFAKKLIEKSLNQKIGNITYIDPEKDFLEGIYKKDVKLDIYVEDDLGNCFDIEMQNYQRKDDSIPLRMRYYLKMMDGNCLKKKENYNKLFYAHTIAICNYPIYTKDKRRFSFISFDEDEKDIEQEWNIKNVYLSTKNKVGRFYIDPELNSFLEYIKDNTHIDCEFVKEIDEEVKRINLNPEKKKAMLTYQMERNYLRAEGRAEGEAKGRAEGKAEGRAEGRAENLEKVILNCLKQNYALDAIASITDSTVKKIKSIAKKHKIEIDE